jgi:hypothetical protein
VSAWIRVPNAAPRTLHVCAGGLDEKVDEAVLHAAFVPFGDIITVEVPRESLGAKHRGYGFVEFELMVRNWAECFVR